MISGGKSSNINVVVVRDPKAVTPHPSLEESVNEAIRTLQSPQCGNFFDCYLVDYKDVFREMTTENHIVPPLWRQDPSVKKYMGEALDHLLSAVRFTLWVNAEGVDRLSKTARNVLADVYLARVTDALKKARVENSFYGGLAFLSNGLKTVSFDHRLVVVEQLRGIMTGYALYLQEYYGIQINWAEVNRQISGQTSPPESFEVQAPEVATKEDKPNPPPPPPLPPPPKKDPPKKKDLTDVAKETGGKHRIMVKDHFSSWHDDPIKQALTLKKPARYVQVQFLIDSSGSMRGEIMRTREKLEEYMQYVKSQMTPGGGVSIAVRYYVDDTSKRAVPLDSIIQMGLNAANPSGQVEEIEDAKNGITEALKFTEAVGGSTEYHWTVAMSSLREEPWVPVKNKDIERIIILLTDEPGDVGADQLTAEDVITNAKSKDVRFEVIQQLELSPERARAILNQKPWTHGKPFIVETGDQGNSIDALKSLHSKQDIPLFAKILSDKTYYYYARAIAFLELFEFDTPAARAAIQKAGFKGLADDHKKLLLHARTTEEKEKLQRETFAIFLQMVNRDEYDKKYGHLEREEYSEAR